MMSSKRCSVDPESASRLWELSSELTGARLAVKS
jgi:hypothetical protein